MKVQFCILLSVGLLAAGVGNAAAYPGESLSMWRPPPGDTSRFFELRDPLGRPPLCSRGDSRLHRRAGAEPILPVSSTAPSILSRTTLAPVEPVADPNLWGANGNVLGIARAGNTLYIAGSFRSVGENSGGCVPIDAATGEPIKPFPKVAGFVYVIVPDGSGGWYIGGEFTGVAGKPRSCLAQIRADGTVSDWNPSVTGSPGYINPPSVSGMAVWGDRVFVGGSFREIGGQARMNIGCVDRRTGAVLDWNPGTHVDGFVGPLAIHDSTLFAGGDFDSIGGQARSKLAAVDAITGAVKPWQAVLAGGPVLAMLVREDTLYVAGRFGWISGNFRSFLAALDVHTAQVLPFDAHASGMYVPYVPVPQIRAMALVGNTLYVAGNFTQIGGQSRSSFAAVNVVTGEALAWEPDSLGLRYEGFPPPLCNALAVSGATIYMGGFFETVAGQSHPFVAAFSRETGKVAAWDPKPDLEVDALAVKGDTVYIGGYFSLLGEWKHRAGIAAIDLTTGAVRPWNPNPDGIICTAVAVSGDRVFVSGDFATIGGDPQPRRYFAALDTINGEVTAWNPGANSLAGVLLLQGDTLYAGGQFTQIGGQPRNYAAALSTATGEVMPWDPNAGWPVFAMARSENTMYLGGIFQQMGGQQRRGIAAVDVTTGALAPWDPDTDSGTIDAVLLNGNTIYVGGAFGRIGGQPRSSLAALDLATGSATAWHPTLTNWYLAYPRVNALAMLDSVLYVGGNFSGVGGEPRICLAAVDTSIGLPTDWNPGADGLVWSLAAHGNTVYAGGGFSRAGGLPAVGLAAFSPAAEPVSVPTPFALAQSFPNPARSSAIIRYALPQAAPVSLLIYDLQGRHVATLLDRVVQESGRHDVPVQANHWKPGVYFYRLEAGHRSATRKMVIIE
ncbi:MAG: T9SS type A sorting domain-containing protein [Candidatus Eisenbacteria bacterium]|nr:T9SS type A sorting domain-containing protein [Candidatus Eisenbacteria bacterium]